MICFIPNGIVTFFILLTISEFIVAKKYRNYINLFEVEPFKIVVQRMIFGVKIRCEFSKKICWNCTFLWCYLGQNIGTKASKKHQIQCPISQKCIDLWTFFLVGLQQSCPFFFVLYIFLSTERKKRERTIALL